MKERKKKSVISAGHICLDITPAVFQGKKYNNISEFLVPGSLISVGKPDVHIGGSVGNTGLAMRIMGAEVTLMGKIGNDEFGRLVLSQLAEYGDCSGMIVSDKADTSYSTVIAVPGVDRIILHNSGANHTFTAEDIDERFVENASLFHFGYPTLMRSMYQNEGKPMIELLKWVKSMGAATSLDMAIVDEDCESGQVNWEKVLQEAMPYIDMFVPSVEELAFMIDRSRYHEWKLRCKGGDITSILSLEEDIRPLADKLLSWGAKILLIKCGAPGLYLRTNTKEYISKIGGGLGAEMADWAEVDFFEKSYKPEQVLSATGAGDTSIAAFLCAILEGCLWQEALHLAAAAGASCVASYDALSGLKSLEELKKKIADGWEKQE